MKLASLNLFLRTLSCGEQACMDRSFCLMPCQCFNRFVFANTAGRWHLPCHESMAQKQERIARAMRVLRSFKVNILASQHPLLSLLSSCACDDWASCSLRLKSMATNLIRGKQGRLQVLSGAVRSLKRYISPKSIIPYNPRKSRLSLFSPL